MQVEALVPMLSDLGLGTPTKDIFVYYMGPQVIAGIVLLPSLGGAKINWELTGWRRDDGFQVIVRNSDLGTALRKARVVFDGLTIQQPIVLPRTAVSPSLNLRYCRPMSEPIPYPRQPDGIWEVSINFLATYSVAD